MCCLLESFKNFETLIGKRRTLGEHFDFEVNHWTKVANKTANINVQNRSLYAS